MTDRRIQLELFLPDCGSSGGELVAISTGPGGSSVGALSLLTKPDYRETSASGVSFAKIKSDREQEYSLRNFRGPDGSSLKISGQIWNFHFAQPLQGGRWLLAGGRCQNYPDGSHDKNGMVFDADGNLERVFLLGDGIQDIQTTSDGKIWTSYFDEGIFGNFGWSHPIGGAGLICWTDEGEKLYEFSPAGKGAELDAIADCYALNVSSDQETWVCYYTDFPLVKITDLKISGVWEQPVGASNSFAVWRDSVLFQGGYDEADHFFLCRFEAGDKLVLKETVVFQDESGRDLPRLVCQGRGPFLFLFAGLGVYRVDLRRWE